MSDSRLCSGPRSWSAHVMLPLWYCPHDPLLPSFYAFHLIIYILSTCDTVIPFHYLTRHALRTPLLLADAYRFSAQPVIVTSTCILTVPRCTYRFPDWAYFSREGASRLILLNNFRILTFVYCTLVFAITRSFPENRPRDLHRFTAPFTVDTCPINFISIFLESLVHINPEPEWFVFNSREATNSRSKSSLLLTCARPVLSCSAFFPASPVLSCLSRPVLLFLLCPARPALSCSSCYVLLRLVLSCSSTCTRFKSNFLHLARLTQSIVSNRHHEENPSWQVFCLSMVSPIRCERQVSWGYWRMVLLATSVVSAWLPQSDLSKKDQRAVTLLQWIKIYQNHTTPFCNGFIVVSKDCTLSLIIFQELSYLNMVETEHCTFFRECIVILLNILSLLLICSELIR
jgi:hypothetical protein